MFLIRKFKYSDMIHCVNWYDWHQVSFQRIMLPSTSESSNPHLGMLNQNIPEELDPQQHQCQNLKSCRFLICYANNVIKNTTFSIWLMVIKLKVMHGQGQLHSFTTADCLGCRVNSHLILLLALKCPPSNSTWKKKWVTHSIQYFG